MRNRETARYARLAAIAAGVLALVVAGVYLERARREARARRDAPPMVPATVERQQAEFTFSKVEQDRTLYTIRASRATQYKDQNRALLEDVWITIYGRERNRNDNIHTRECSYEPATGAIRCAGEVQIDIEGANPASGKPADKRLEVKTRDLSFNRETGEASTAEAVEFRFPAGEGRGLGVRYSTRDSVVRIEHSVELNLTASPSTEGLPEAVTGSSLEIRRNERVLELGGPAVVRQGSRGLSADKISIQLDENYQARRAVAEGHAAIHAGEGGAKISVSADKFDSLLFPNGWAERIIASGKFVGTRQTASGTETFRAAHVEFAMLPEHNLVKEMTATGGVTAESRQEGGAHLLKTEALRVTFSPRESAKQKTAEQRIERAETMAPGTIESRSGNEITSLRAHRFVANLSATGRLDTLFGHSGVEIRRQPPSGAAQHSSALELVAAFGADGEWDRLVETGNVRFEQADRRAVADRAEIVRASAMITLDGSPGISDSLGSTTARSMAINQQSGELRAVGRVVSTYLAGSERDAVSLGSGPAHITADSLAASTTSGHVAYTGHARLWQGESVLEADQIELWRDDRKIEATSHVVAVFPQASSPFAKHPAKSPGAPSLPTVWNVRAPVLTYWSDQAKAHLEGGVIASSDEGSIESRTLDAFLTASGPTPDSAGASPGRPKAPRGSVDPLGGRQLDRVLAEGAVVVRQGGRRAMAERAEYTADGKFVLSGGRPTLTDASSDTTTGHSLTFFVANDTILIDSQEGFRTLTRHRVEK
ncbi:MAG TPA: LPS export ABC transporter periplasmic protein LptC [Verrucomicrobiae bacterium]|nr:LPS export ABC transporter periplasmic protein LptC [Verrucomicrobiae bacterium]